MKKSTKILFLVLALALVAGLLTFIWVRFSPSAAPGDKTITVEVTHLDGTVKSIPIHTDEDFLAPALEDVIAGKQESYGLFIDTVDGEFADPEKNRWWVFTVNGEMGVYGADTQPIADGDTFAFSVYEG